MTLEEALAEIARLRSRGGRSAEEGGSEDEDQPEEEEAEADGAVAPGGVRQQASARVATMAVSTAMEKPRMAAVAVPELLYMQASRPKVLEEWLFKVGKALAQQGLHNAPLEEQASVFSMFWNKPLDDWYQRKVQTEISKKTPILNFARLGAEMKEFFLSATDEEKAVTEIGQLRMAQNESMDSYIQRATAVSSRIREKRQALEQQAEFVAKGVPITRFPSLYAKIEEEQQKHRAANDGSGIQLMEMLQLLSELARHEPLELLAAARRAEEQFKGGFDGAGSKTPWRGNFGANKKAGAPFNQQRLSHLGELEENDSNGERGQDAPDDDPMRQYIMELVSHQLSAMQNGRREGGTCHNCGKVGHWLSDCPTLANVRCYRCQGRGHISRNCTNAPVARPRSDASSSSTSTQNGLKAGARGGQ